MDLNTSAGAIGVATTLVLAFGNWAKQKHFSTRQTLVVVYAISLIVSLGQLLASGQLHVDTLTSGVLYGQALLVFGATNATYHLLKAKLLPELGLARVQNAVDAVMGTLAGANVLADPTGGLMALPQAVVNGVTSLLKPPADTTADVLARLDARYKAGLVTDETTGKPLTEAEYQSTRANLVKQLGQDA